MRGALKITSIRGIRVFIHWTFLLLIGWLLLINARMGNNIGQLAWSLLFLIAVFACVTLHELGHAFMARRFGIKVKNIVLLPIGGIASMEKFPDNPRQELAISIAGPVVNIVIAGLLWLMMLPGDASWKLPADTSITRGHDFLYNLRMVNLGLAVFNLIPAFPMDGGRILRALLGLKLNYIQATAIAAGVGKVIAAIFIIWGILTVNLLLPVIGIFIIYAASTEEYYLQLKSLAKGVKLKDVLMYDYTSLPAGMTVWEAAAILENNHNKYFILVDRGRPAGSVNRMEIVKAIAEKKYNEPLKNLVKEEPEYLDSSNDIDTAMEKLARDHERIYPVMDNSHITGVVNFDHIIEYLLLHKADTKGYGRIKPLTGLL